MTTELSPRARALLDSARQAPCEADARTVERMEKAVLVATGATVVTTAAGATAAKTAAGLTLTTKLFIVGTVVVVAGAALTVPSQPPAVSGAEERSTKAVVAPPPAPAVAQPEVKTEPVAPPADPKPAAPPVVAAKPRVVVAPPALPVVEPLPVAAPPPVQSAPDLAKELALLSVAKTALGENRFRAVLAQIEKHDAEFPNGTLSVEAEVLRVLALCEIDREAEALDRASKLRATAKSSPALKRLGGSCVDP